MKRHEVRVMNYDPQRVVVDDCQLQKNLDDDALVAWLLALGPWDVIAHLTWRDKLCFYRDGTLKPVGISEYAAARGVERFMVDLPGVSYFYAVEKNPSRDGHHAHCLWGDCQNVFRKDQWAKWVKRHGRARIEPVHSDEDVSGYASKYVMKLPCWWNIRLRWHRWNGLHRVGFSLESLPVVLDNSQPQDSPVGGRSVISESVDRDAAPAGETFWNETRPGVWENGSVVC